MRGRKGLSLLELLMVIVIAIVLSSGVVVGFRAINIKAQEKEAQAKLRTILAAADVYRARFGTYPDSLLPTGTTSLVGQGYIQDPNPTPGTGNVLRTNWTFAISSPSATAITITATANAGTVIYPRSFSVTKNLSSTPQVTGTGSPVASDWYNNP